MIIFLYGQNSYSLIQYVNQLVDRYRKKHPESFNLHRFDLEEDNPAEIENAIKGVSFFNEVKFVVIKNPMAKSAALEKILKENDIARQKDAVLLLYQNGAEKEIKEKNQKIFDLLKRESQIKEFKPPTIQAANKFAASYLVKHPEGKPSASYGAGPVRGREGPQRASASNGAGKISAKKEVIAKLIKQTGPDLWRLKNELDKLISLAKSEGRNEIIDEDLTKLINFKIDHNIFDIIEMAFSNQAKALILFENFLADGGDPLYLLSMIAFQLKNMLIVRELMDPEADTSHRHGASKNLQYGEILKKSGMHPFFFKKNYEAAKKYSLSDLKKIFQKTADFEIALKTGQAEPENIFFKIFI